MRNQLKLENKKIALLVFHIHPSHGCILQTFALYTCLKEMGYDVDIIDRQIQMPSRLGILKSMLKNIIKYFITSYKGPIYPEIGPRSKKMTELNKFVDRFLSPRIIRVWSDSELDSIPWSKYDAIVVGSDQTWRPKYVPNVLNYYLSFARDIDIKRIAFGPSFGTAEWEYSDKLTDTCKQLAQKFEAIAMREKSGVVLCKEKYGVDAVNVLDPTFLFSGEDYTKIIGLTLEPINQVGCYYLDYTDEKKSVAEKVAAALGYPINYVNRDMQNNYAPLKDQIAPSIESWLSNILNSKFVVVDSFHAMAFCIQFHKPFLVIGNVNRGLSRFTDLLSIIGLEDRIILTANELDMSILNKAIDWGKVDSIISEKRRFGKDFLQAAIEK